MRLSEVVAVMSDVVKAGPERKQVGMSLAVTSMTHANVQATLMEVYCYINGGVLRMEEPGVIAAVAKEELMLKSGVQVGESMQLRLEDRADMFARCDDIESNEEVVVCKSNDML
jgi:hypothetical protein